MKFVSKASNYMAILKQGIPSNYALGTPSTPSINVRFENGVANVDDPGHIELMMKHSGMNRDFYVVEDSAKDPFANKRKDLEPGHVIQDLSSGRPGQSMGSPVKPPEAVVLMATEIAKGMAKEIVKGLVPDLVATIRKEIEEEKAEKKVSKKKKASEPEADNIAIGETTS